jgi:hypothetical protein
LRHKTMLAEFNAPMLCCAKPQVPKTCVFKTLMGEEPSDSGFVYSTPANIQLVLDKGLAWINEAQLPDGGWSANMHTVQKKLKNDQTVVGGVSDPASTAMVCMALLRCQNTPEAGKYAALLSKGMQFLMQATEGSANNPRNITDITGTQPQRKLGANIDVVLTAQFFNNLLNVLKKDDPSVARVKKCLELCVDKIQKAQTDNGSLADSGWAGVLQSSFASNALESAQANGIKVDQQKLDKSRDFQKKNYDAKTGKVNTELGAGVLLYSVSGSSRASAQEARMAKENIAAAKKKGVLTEKEDVSVDNLKKAGLGESDAIRYAAAYEINEAAKQTAQQENVLKGFGNNGGEEFLSYLQTGEGLVIAKDEGWKKWYDNISGKLISIQNQDGSWNGHHCITSPVFCTATCLLVLSINNDIGHLQK